MSKGQAVLKAMRLGEQPTILVSYLYGGLDLGLFSQKATSSCALVGVGFLFVSVAGFVLNEFADRKADERRLDREASHLSVAVTASIVSLFSIAGLMFGYLGGSPLCTTGILISALLYSLPKVHLKRRCGLDMLCLGLCFVIIPYYAPYEMLADRLQTGPANTFHVLNVLTLLFFLAACNLVAMIRDIDPDHEAGIRNSTVCLGLEGSLRLGVLLAMTAGAMGIFVFSDRTLLWYSPILLCVPLLACIFGFGLGAKEDRKQVQAYFSAKAKMGIATGNVLVALLALFALLAWYSTIDL